MPRRVNRSRPCGASYSYDESLCPDDIQERAATIQDYGKEEKYVT
jgi:hypothetical protein